MAPIELSAIKFSVVVILFQEGLSLQKSMNKVRGQWGGGGLEIYFHKGRKGCQFKWIHAPAAPWEGGGGVVVAFFRNQLAEGLQVGGNACF